VEPGESDESACFGQENLQELQDHPPRRRDPGDLHGPAPQTAARLKTLKAIAGSGKMIGFA
jgi:hypothetical protein